MFLYSPGATWILLSISIFEYTNARERFDSIPCACCQAQNERTTTDVWVASPGGWWRFSKYLGEAVMVWSHCWLPCYLMSCGLFGAGLLLDWLKGGNCKTCAWSQWVLDSGSWFDFIFLLHQEVKMNIAKEINVGACAQCGEEWFGWIMEAV